MSNCARIHGWLTKACAAWGECACSFCSGLFCNTCARDRDACAAIMGRTAALMRYMQCMCIRGLRCRRFHPGAQLVDIHVNQLCTWLSILTASQPQHAYLPSRHLLDRSSTCLGARTSSARNQTQVQRAAATLRREASHPHIVKLYYNPASCINASMCNDIPVTFSLSIMHPPSCGRITVSDRHYSRRNANWNGIPVYLPVSP